MGRVYEEFSDWIGLERGNDGVGRPGVKMRLFCGFVLVVGVCVVCVGPLGAACVVLGGGCVWMFSCRV